MQFCITADRGDGSEVYRITIMSDTITTQGTVHTWCSLMLHVCYVVVRWFCGFPGTDDHEEFQQDVTLSATNNRHCASISITDDALPEENELFQVTVLNVQRVSSNFFPFQIHTPVTTVTILDDDGQFNKVYALLYCRG